LLKGELREGHVLSEGPEGKSLLISLLRKGEPLREKSLLLSPCEGEIHGKGARILLSIFIGVRITAEYFLVKGRPHISGYPLEMDKKFRILPIV
jgi:hypothetical protein